MLWSSFRAQLVVALILVLMLGALFAASAWVIGAATVRKLTHKPTPRRFRWVRRGIVALAGAAPLCIAYAYFIEPYWLEVTHVRLPMAKLPAGARAIRIVHISDLHCESQARLEADLPRIVRELKPDLIVFTGDGFNSLPGLERFRRCMAQLAVIAPTFAVQGNWDRRHGTEHFVDGTGAQELTGQAVRVQVAGAELYLIGAGWGHWAAVERALATVPGEATKVVLYHSPDAIPSAAKLGVDLYLCGHTHGGQVALPFYGALVTLSSTGKRFEAGLYHVGDTTAYVSRGIGMEGGRVPRVRFCARPEVTLIELSPGHDEKGHRPGEQEVLATSGLGHWPEEQGKVEDPLWAAKVDRRRVSLLPPQWGQAALAFREATSNSKSFPQPPQVYSYMGMVPWPMRLGPPGFIRPSIAAGRMSRQVRAGRDSTPAGAFTRRGLGPGHPVAAGPRG